jgi:hypothetical protein
MRFSGAWGPDIEEGEYMYEWSDGSRGQGQTVRTAACMALSPDLETLLCVTRDGIAYSFAVRSQAPGEKFNLENIPVNGI